MTPKEIYSYQGILTQIQSPYTVKWDPKWKVSIDDSVILGLKNIQVLSEKGFDQMRVMTAYPRAGKRQFWWTPIEKGFLNYIKTSRGLLLMYANKKTVPLLDIERGGVRKKIHLPCSIITSKDRLHITPSGTCFFIIMNMMPRTLFIKNIDDEKWTRYETPPGFIHFYDEFACFKCEAQKTQYLIDKKGQQHRFSDCQDIQIADGKLYKAMKDAKSTQLSVQKILKNSDFKLADRKCSISLSSRNIQILNFPGNNLCLALHDRYLVLIDIKSKKIRKLQKFLPFHSQYITDQKTQTVWCLADDNILRKHTLDKSVEAARLNADKALILHVDENERLYYLEL